MALARLQLLVAAALVVLTPSAPLGFLSAQQSVATSTSTPPPPPPPSKPTLDFSGVIFGNYQYNTGAANSNANSFNVDRAYLTFKMPAGERVSIRVTADVFQDAAPNANAFTIRAKYAYLQYDVPKFSSGASLFARIGILHTVEIDHEEGFWPRYLATTGVERAGFFSSADVGAASQLTLPNKMGEIYATITNGPGYTSKETDRFKDYAVRLSLTPLMGSAAAPEILRTLTLTGWAYQGSLASKFASGGAGQLAPLGEAMPRTRYGVLAGIKDPRLTLVGEYATATTGTESGANTAAAPRLRTDLEAHLLTAFTVVRPLAFINGTPNSPFAVVARYDRYEPVRNIGNYSYHFLLGGVSYDISSKASLALDYQEQLPSGGAVVPAAIGSTGTAGVPAANLKTYLMHFVVNF